MVIKRTSRLRPDSGRYATRVGPIIVRCNPPEQKPAGSSEPATRRLGWFSRHYRALKLVVTVIAVLVGVHEYLRQQWNGRVERSLALYERYQSGEVMEARIALDRVWNSTTMWDELIALHDDQGSLRYAQTVELALQAVTDRAAVDSLYVVWNVMREASLCLAQKQCDQYTICRAFWADAQKTYYFFQPYFEDRDFAWDETVQNPEGYAWSLFHENCGIGNIICLFERRDFRSQTKRYLNETFNIRETGRSKCIPDRGKDDTGGPSPFSGPDDTGGPLPSSG